MDLDKNALDRYITGNYGEDQFDGEDDEEVEPEPDTHEHRCQQCDVLLVSFCVCTNPNRLDWCSSNCRAAFDL